MKRIPVIIYTRVSTKKQSKKGVSLEDQSRELEKFAEENHLHCAQFFSEVMSGRREKKGKVRREFEAACRLAVKNDWPILVTTASRFTRKLGEFDSWVAKGLRLIVASRGVDATAHDVRTSLIMEIDHYEQLQRTAAMGWQRAIAQGKLRGHSVPAHGRDKSVQTRRNAARQGYEAFLRHEGRARDEGAQTPRELAVAFNRLGFMTPNGERWKDGNVRRVLEAIARLRAEGVALGETASEACHAGPASLLRDSGSILIADSRDRGGAAKADKFTEDHAAPVPIGHPLSPAELQELRDLLTERMNEPEKVEGLLKTAALPTLPLNGRLRFLEWMAQKRAARPAV